MSEEDHASDDENTDTAPLFYGHFPSKVSQLPSYCSLSMILFGKAKLPSGQTMIVSVNYNLRAKLSVVAISGEEPGRAIFQGD